MNFHLIPFQILKSFFEMRQLPHFLFIFPHFFGPQYQFCGNFKYFPSSPPITFTAFSFHFNLNTIQNTQKIRFFALPLIPHETSPAEFGWAKPNQTYNLFSLISNKIFKIV
jgi:hypothetical protein